MKQWQSIFNEDKIPDNFDKFLEKIKELTKHNNHGEARLETAKFFKFKKFVNILEAVERIHDMDDGNVHNLLLYRDDLVKQMMSLIERHYGKEIKDKVWSRL
jgi:hypothetical protein